MTRGVGEFTIQEFVPEWGAVAVAILTQLGDLWFLGLLLGVFYWTRPDRQDEIAVVGATLLTGIGLYRGFKELFALPRPNEPPVATAWFPDLLQPLWESIVAPASYGFPSGHATSATIVYVGLAAVLAVGARRRRFAVAGLLVGVVSLSRIVLGVHYLVDVVAGTALGLCLVALGVRALQTQRLTALFALTVPAAGFAVLASHAGFESVLLLGATLGAFLGWQVVAVARERTATDGSPGERRTLAMRCGLATLGVASLLVVLELVPALPDATLLQYVAAAALAILVAAVVVAPVARHSQHVRRVLMPTHS
ncbi:phosphatase PAP2 family protein [Halovenus marina]|uniref:phosphatase PAP2 family protein n=1 Tax=Halovenus marina TaxID=3396621 RepID=UPI003F55F5CC